MSSFSQQFKTILWKNWKIFNKKTSIFLCAFELFYTFLIVTLISVRSKVKIEIPEVLAPPPLDISHQFAVFNKNGMIAFVLPNNQTNYIADNFINNVMNDPNIKEATNVKSIQFGSQEELEKFVREDNNDSILCGIVFDDDNFTNYSIRIKGSKIVNSKEEPIWDFARSRKDEVHMSINLLDDNRYITDILDGIVESDKYISLFIHIQIAVDNAIIQMKTNNEVHGLSLEIGKFSKAAIEYNSSINEHKREFNGITAYAMFLCIGQFFHISTHLMSEKENKTKEGLISIGVNPFLLWFTWEIIYLPLSVILIIFYILFDPSKVLGSINPLLLISLFVVYTISLYNLAVIVSNLIKKPRTVSVVTFLFIACMITINKYIFNLKIKGQSQIEKILSSIFSPVGISMACEEICYEADNERYIGIRNMFDSEFGRYFIFMIVDCITYLAIAVILDFINKVDVKNIWISNSKIKKDLQDSYLYNEDIQPDPFGNECYVQVKNICKYYKFRRNINTDNDDDSKKMGKVFAANKNISFNVYKDEIFAILGHNGAGKSTLIQGMVGMIKPDGGETYYRGLPFSKHKKEIQRQLGICLQNNILFKGFTVADHFKLFSGIKGSGNDNLDQWLEEIDLVEKKDFEVQKMSGGQKRKLCIGLALIGNPKYVFLDEPTTGLDPLSRRKIWNLLLKVKKNRVTFITTHYMDEADIIADRKLILNNGSIRCLGSSVYLKNHFQMKYNLEVETTEPEKVGKLIHDHVPESVFFNNKTQFENINSVGANTYTWKLPIHASFLFSNLLKDLENERGKHLNHFSLNAPILEELFVNLENEMEMKKGRETPEMNSNKVIELPNTENIKRPGTIRTALRLSRYRIKVYFRQKTYLFMGILIPVAILGVFLPIIGDSLRHFGFSDYEKREISSSLYKNQKWNYDILNSFTLKPVITTNILEQELPIQHGTLELMTTSEINEKSLHVTTEPYYVSSFSGSYADNNYHFTIYYNDSMIHSLPASINTLSNAVLASRNINDTIHMSSYPLNFFDLNRIAPIKLVALLIIIFCISFPLSFYGTNVVRERSQNLLKQLQLNGISNKSYWLSVLFSDHIVFMVTYLIILMTFLICKFMPFFHPTILIFLGIYAIICAIACLLFQYCVSYIFENERKALLIFFIFNIIPPYAINIKASLESIEPDSAETPDVIYYLAALILLCSSLFPNYGFIRVIRSMINIGIKHKAIGTEISTLKLLSPQNQIITCIIGTIIAISIYGRILIILTKKKYDPKKKVLTLSEEMNQKFNKEIEEADEDIRKEYERVLKDHDTNKLPIKIIKLSKEYDDLSFESRQEIMEGINRKDYKYGELHMSDMGGSRLVMTAFKNVTLGVDKRECFGILGPNGSGKTSLLNTTSFTFPQTLGNIYYDGKDTLERKGNEIILGYCPQEDTLWDEFSLFEHIEMFLYLRGYSMREAKRITNQFISYCRLTEHKNKMPYELSGGTRRKLNILIALCCSSSKIIMDEPTAGMDPSTRRYFWDIIKATLQSAQSSTIMSTHSMEEAELLCNRIAIMIKGKIKCIGTPEHLKMKYGNSYILDVHSDDVEKFHNEVVIGRDLFLGSSFEREDKSSHRVKYEVRSTSNISHVFDVMESCRKKGLFTDYSYSQTSLEQVFLNFAMESVEDDYPKK